MRDRDLMVSDWVYRIDFKNPVPSKIIGIEVVNYDKMGYVVDVLNKNGYNVQLYLNEIEPIPLTPEILEENGWEKTPTGHVFYTDGKRYDNSLWYIFCSNTFVVNTAEFQIKYVHELQHALRLCGIDKEIEL